MATKIIKKIKLKKWLERNRRNFLVTAIVIELGGILIGYIYILSGIHSVDLAFNALKIEHDWKINLWDKAGDIGADGYIRSFQTIYINGLNEVFTGSIFILGASLAFGMDLESLRRENKILERVKI